MDVEGVTRGSMVSSSYARRMDERDDGGLARLKEGKEVWGLTERLLSYDPES